MKLKQLFNDGVDWLVRQYISNAILRQIVHGGVMLGALILVLVLSLVFKWVFVLLLAGCALAVLVLLAWMLGSMIEDFRNGG